MQTTLKVLFYAATLVSATESSLGNTQILGGRSRQRRSAEIVKAEGETDLGFSPGVVSNKVMLNNKNDKVYSGPMFFSSPIQGSFKSRFIYDTTSSMTAVTNSTCTTCPTQYYNMTASTSATLSNDTAYANIQNLTFEQGNLAVNGAVYNEIACINATDAWSCTDKQFPIFVVESMQETAETAQKFADIDGVIGFGPPTGNKTFAGNNATSYILALHKAKKISEPVMAMNLNYNDKSDSYIVIGSAPFANSGKQYKYPVDTSKYDKWTLELTKLTYGKTELWASSGLQTAVLDSSYSFLGLPKNDYLAFALNVSQISGVSCNTGVPGMGIRCLSTTHKCSELEDLLLPITLKFGKQSFVIPAKGYTVTDPAEGVECMIAVDQYQYPDNAPGTPIILGDTFLRNFRTTYDYNQVAITLSVNPVNHADININGLTPTGLTGLITGSAILLVIIGVTMCCICCGKCGCCAAAKSVVDRNWDNMIDDEEAITLDDKENKDDLLLDNLPEDKEQ